MLDSRQVTDDLRGQFRGVLHFDALTRGLYSTDASAFQVVPAAVAVPMDADDLSVLVRYCFEHNVPVIARGAGTGLAGESLGPAVILDLSVTFRRIRDVTADSITAEAGVTCSALNAELAKQGRRLAPDPASSDTCTLGGMVATNASGGNAFRHGYLRDYVCGLDVVLDDGSRGRFDRDAGAGRGERVRAIERAVAELLAVHRDLIAQPRFSFDRCGYLLHDVLTAHGPDLAKLLVGSEGTLGITTAATVRSIPLAGGTCVALFGFPTLDAAVRAGLDLRHCEPVACDLLDRRLLSVTRRVAEPIGLIPPAVGAALLVTFEADTERTASEQAWGAVEKLRSAHLMRVLAEPTCEPDGIARVHGVRRAAVAGLQHLARGPRPLAFIEDVGVPAELLPEFLAGVQDTLKQSEISASFLIHVLSGQVHTRPLVDLDNPADRVKLWPVAEAVHSLALALGGTVSTQHGTGLARTPWVEKQAGPLYGVFRELKRIFDPRNLLNPGKIVGPDPSREAWPLRAVAGHPAPVRDEPEPGAIAAGANESNGRSPLLIWKESSPLEEASRCSGCGDCRTARTSKRMCPVFRATGTEAATPRAKANLARMLADPHSVTPEEVKAVAALCINCKMCRDECDARVNIPRLMLEMKAELQSEHGLDRADWFLARADGLASVGSNFAPLVNGLLARRSTRWLLEKVFGVSRRRQLPAFALGNFYRRARRAGLTRARTPPSGGIARRLTRVAYFVDVFAAYNDPLVGIATVEVLRHNGIEVYVPPRQVGCGMAALAVGDVETARETAIRNVRILADLVREGYHIVCSEPTAALMLSQDYLDLVDDADTAAVAAGTIELTAFLGELHAAGRLRTDFHQVDLAVGHHIPCHVKALRRPAVSTDLLALIPGLRVRTIDAGCSGMAGTWGLKAVNHATSLAAGAGMLAELDRPGVLFGSTECSACRMQMQEGSGKRTLHPVQYLAYAYGLMPEIAANLKRPLGRLVSD